MKRLLCLAAAVAVLSVSEAAPAAAEGSGAAPSAYSADRLSKEGFVPAAPGQAVEDTVPGGLLMLTAYGVLWTLVDGKPQPVAVRLGASDGTVTEVSGDITEGDLVITGQERPAE